jgi:hypothetical protein
MPETPEMRTWQEHRDRIHRQLERQTGEGVEAWNLKIKAAAPADEPALRAWLADRSVTGYPAMLLAWETFGYPDFLTASADELLDAQYADRPDLRPVFDAVIAAVSAFEGAEAQARKTYVSLLTPRRTFGIVQASTKKRVDVGLRLENVEPAGRLLLAKSLGNDMITRRLALASVDDLDDEALDWIRRAYEANS